MIFWHCFIRKNWSKVFMRQLTIEPRIKHWDNFDLNGYFFSGFSDKFMGFSQFNWKRRREIEWKEQEKEGFCILFSVCEHGRASLRLTWGFTVLLIYCTADFERVLVLGEHRCRQTTCPVLTTGPVRRSTADRGSTGVRVSVMDRSLASSGLRPAAILAPCKHPSPPFWNPPDNHVVRLRWWKYCILWRTINIWMS